MMACVTVEATGGREEQVMAVRRRPEERLINDYAVVQEGARKLVAGAAFLAVTWSTVVLLGGLVTELPFREFWLVTLMSLVFGSRILTVYEYEDGLLKASESVYHGWHTYLSNRMVQAPLQTQLMAILLAVSIAFIQLVGMSLVILYLFGPLFCIVASAMHFDHKFFHGVKGNNNDDGARARVKAALQILYILALVQAVLFYIWLVFFWTEPRRVAEVSRQLKFGRWGRSLVQRYLRETKARCAKDFALPDSWNLVTFAVSLMASGAWDDQLSGARILDTFVGHQQQDVPAGPAIRVYLLSSQRCIGNLISALGWRGHDHREIRERATRIVADVAGEISITQFPGALQCICSLLECSDAQQGQGGRNMITGRVATKRRNNGPSPTLLFYMVYEAKLKATEIQDKDCQGTSFVPQGPEELVLNGLLILERIAHSEQNCRAICNDDALLKRIMAPMNSLALTNAADFSDMAVRVLDRPMRVICRIISAPGDASRNLRLQIAGNADMVQSMMATLQGDRISGNLKAIAMEILTEVALLTDSMCMTNETKARFVRILLSVFLGDRNDEEVRVELKEDAEIVYAGGLRRKAGESLARLLSAETVSDSMDVLLLEMFWVSEPVRAQTMRQNGGSVVHQLSELLTAETIYCRIGAAEILQNLFYHSSKWCEGYTDSFITLLPKVVEQILCTETEAETNAEVEANTFSAPISDVENQYTRDNANPSSLSAERNHEQQEKRRLLSSLLSIILVICNSLAAGAGGEFPCVLQKAFPGDDSFVKKLKQVVETNSCAAVDCLRILKITSHVVILVSRHIPGYVGYLEEHKFVESLSTALAIMSGIDCCMFFSNGCQQRMKPFRSLYSLVKETRDMVHESEARAA